MTSPVVLITGSSRGIGRATALTLAEHGARVVITARDMTALEQVASDIRARGGQCLALCMDVTDPASIRQAIHQAHAHYGRIDVLVNNAGMLRFADIAQTSATDWARTLSTNLTGPFLCIQAVLPIMLAQGHGHIINIASQAGLYGFANLGAYSASKFGLVGLSQSLGRELQGSGINVSYLCPGAVTTDMLSAFPEHAAAAMPQDTPEHIAQCIYELTAGDKTAFQRVSFWHKMIRYIKRRLGFSQIKVWSSRLNGLLAIMFFPGLSKLVASAEFLMTDLPAVIM
ncbi:MAG: SDR family NAD(P)-dependent oxidoreductase [Gammaproteobacteria bacterium]